MFSVVIPIYNHAKFQRQAIWSALRSSLVTEILLLDDGSKDESAKIAASMAAAHPDRIRDLTPPSGGNRGAHNRLNELVEQARNEWIAVLNSDDAFVSGRFESITRDPAFGDCDFSFGNVLFMDQRGALIGAKRGPADTWSESLTSAQVLGMLAERRFTELLYERNYVITTSNMVFRRSLHARIGGFRSYRYVHDWDFALRATSLGRAAYIPRFLTAYRIHAGNTIQENKRRSLAETLVMLERWKTP
ncbi:MAG TPA: glycosyltransferase [Bryobacteraceae bacterium]|nr:glycosyltransferase [Bryobacteraceae bacterium]